MADEKFLSLKGFFWCELLALFDLAFLWYQNKDLEIVFASAEMAANSRHFYRITMRQIGLGIKIRL
jgi:hypothetical protein